MTVKPETASIWHAYGCCCCKIQIHTWSYPSPAFFFAVVVADLRSQQVQQLVLPAASKDPNPAKRG